MDKDIRDASLDAYDIEKDIYNLCMVKMSGEIKCMLVNNLYYVEDEQD